MSAADYLRGVVWFALAAGPIAFAATRLLRHRLEYLRGAMAVVAWSLLVTVGLIAEGLIPGTVGVLSRGTVVLTAFALAGATAFWTRAPRAREAVERDGGELARRDTHRSSPASLLIAVVTLVTVAVYITAFLIDRRGVPITAIDALTFGLPTIDRWIQDASVWSVGHYAAGWSFGAYPDNGELVQLAVMLPWRSDAFVRLVGFPYLAFSGVSVYALARELRAPLAAAVAWASASMAIPASLLAALEYQKTDVIMLACFVAGAAFLVRHSRSGLRADLLLGALGLGVAFGSRWYGLPAVAAAVAIWIAARAIGRVPRREVVAHALVVVAVVAAAGGFWLLRNWAQLGDPLFPVKVAPFGITVFDAPPDLIRMRGGFSLLHYATDQHIWRLYLWPSLRDGFGLPGVIGMVACVVALTGFTRAGEARTAVVALTALVLGLVYAATPYTAQGPEGQPVQTFVNIRYGIPAVALATAVAAALGARGHRWTFASTLLGFIAALDGLLHVPDAGLHGFLDHVVRPSRVAEATLALAALVALALVLRTRPLRRLALPPILLLVVAGGYLHERGYTRVGYLGTDPAMDRVLRSAATRPLRIAIAGEGTLTTLSPNHPLTGPRLRNHVRVVGPVVRHTLQPIRDRAQLAIGLRAGYDLVYVMRPRPDLQAPEARWVESLGYRPIVKGRTATLFTRVAGAPKFP